MNEEAAFLAAIAARPGDHTPRLVFADWLDEHGQPERAEFIRRQIQGDGLFERTDITEFMTNLGRTNELLRAHQRDWGGHIPGFNIVNRGEEYRGGLDVGWANESGEWLESKYLGGFLELYQCHGGTWAAHGDAVRASQPVLDVWLISRPEVEDLGEYQRFARDPDGRRFSSHQVSAQAEEREDDPLLVLCELRWPGVRFRLPSEEDDE